VPPGSDLNVDAPQGTSQHSRITTQSQNGGGGSTDTTLDKQSDGAHLIDLTTVNNTPFGPVTIAFHPSPPPRVQPQPVAAGSTVGPFDMTSTDGKTVATVKVTIQAVNEAVTLGDGTSAAAVRVQLDTTLRCASGQPNDCPFTGTINSTRWLRGDGLTVKDHSVTDGTFSGIKINGDTTSLIDKGSPS
jgi:hypothetical protein